MKNPPLDMADEPQRTPLQRLTRDVGDLAGNLLVPPHIRNTLRLAVLVIADQEQRIKTLEANMSVLQDQNVRIRALEDARHG